MQIEIKKDAVSSARVWKVHRIYSLPLSPSHSASVDILFLNDKLN